MRKWLLGLLAFSLFAALLPLRPATAYSEFTTPYTYVNGSNYSVIQDGQGRSFVGNTWVCNSDFSVSRVTTDSAGNRVCDGEPAGFVWINQNPQSGGFALLYADGALAALDGLKANEGIATLRYIAKQTASETNQIKHTVFANNGSSAAKFYESNHITFDETYQYLDDSYETIVDTRRPSHQYELYEGDECPIFSTDTGTTAIIPKSNPGCRDGRYYRYDLGNYTAWIILTATHNTTPLDDGDNIALFFSTDKGGGKLYDYIDFFAIDVSGFFENAETFESKCTQGIGVLSWILCPMINFAMDKVVSPIQDIVLGLLHTDSLLTAPATGNNSYYIYNAWKQFLIIANAMLAAALIIVIYLMLFSQNSAYSAQRMIPRLVVVVIMMQISYFLAAVIVDAGNVLAAGIASIFDAVRVQAIEAGPNFGSGEQATVIPDSIRFLSDSGAARGIGAGFGVILATIGLYLWTMFVPGVIFFVAFGVMISVLGVFVALTLRQLAIVVLIVLAPIAFLFGIFPQTDKWMKEWFDNLMKLILIYPLIALVFGAGGLLSYLALGTGQSEVNMLISSAIGLIVLFTIPALFTLAGRLFNRFSAVITGLSSRVKSSAQGDPKDPLSWRSNVNHTRAMRQYGARRRFTKAVPSAGRFLKPTFKEAQLFSVGQARMQGLISGKHPNNPRRLFWGNKPFKSPKGFANWKDSMISDSAEFASQMGFIYKDPFMFYDTVNAALEDTGFLYDKAINYAWGVGRLAREGKVSKEIAGGWWERYRGDAKGKHRLLHALGPELLTDYDWSDPMHMYQTFYETKLDDIQDQNMRNAVAKYRLAAIEDAGNAVGENSSDGTFVALTTMLSDDSFVDYMAREAKDRDWDGLRHLYLKAQTMEAATRDPRRVSADAADRTAAAGEDGEQFRGGHYGVGGHGIHRREDFFKAVTQAYGRATSSGRDFGF